MLSVIWPTAFPLLLLILLEGLHVSVSALGARLSRLFHGRLSRVASDTEPLPKGLERLPYKQEALGSSPRLPTNTPFRFSDPQIQAFLGLELPVMAREFPATRLCAGCDQPHRRDRRLYCARCEEEIVALAPFSPLFIPQLNPTEYR